MPTNSAKIKVAIQQPALPKYRIPVFKKLVLDHGFELTVFFGTQNNLANEPAEGFQCVPTKARRLSIFAVGEIFFDWAQFRICGDKSWDVIVLAWNARYLTLLPALVRAKLNGIPTILWGHGYSKNPTFFRSMGRNFLTKFADALLFYDPVSRSRFASGKVSQRLFVAPNAIDQTPIQNQRNHWLTTPEKLDHFQALNEVQGKNIVLHVSRIDPDNRLDLIIEAIKIVSQVDPHILLVIIGSGPADELKHLQDLARELDVVDHVLFLGAVYEEESLAPWFLSAKVFCYPANVGLSLMHAFGYGLPVVLGDDLSKCNPEIYAFEESINGVTFADGNPQALADQLIKLISDEAYRRELSNGAYATVQEVANLDRMAEGFADAIRYAVHSKRNGLGFLSS